MVSMYALPYLERDFSASIGIVRFIIDLPAHISERMEVVSYVGNCGCDNRTVLRRDQYLSCQPLQDCNPSSTHKSHEEHREEERYHDQDRFLLWRIVWLIVESLGV